MTPQEELAALRRLAELEAKAGGGNSTPPATPRSPQSTGDALQNAAIQGLTFGFGDEIGAAGNAVGATLGAATTGRINEGQPQQFMARRQPLPARIAGFAGQAYGNALTQRRADLKEFSDQAPVLSTMANIVGGMASFSPMGRGGAITATTPTLPQMIGTGAAAGAVAGAGDAEGGPLQRAEGAAMGGMLGGAIGLGLPLAAKGVGAAAGVAGDMLGMNNPTRTAQDMFLRKLGQDGVSVESLLTTPGGPMSVMDQAGKNTTRLGRTVETVPGAGSDRITTFLNERQQGQGQRILGAIDENMAATRDASGTIDTLMQTRARAAAPLYEKAYAAPFDMQGDEFAGLMSRPSMKQAMSRAYRIAAEEGRDPTALGFQLNDAGDVTFVRQPSMQTMDYVKRGVDDVLNQFRNPVTGRLVLDESGRAIDATRRKLLQAMDQANPDYAAARASWAGPTQSIDAIHFGEDAMRLKPEQITARLAGMTEGEREFVRIGAARQAQSMVENVADGGDVARRLFAKPEMRARLQALFPDEASFAKFTQTMQNEMRMSDTRRQIVGGSATGRIAAEQDEAAAGSASRAGLEAVLGNYTGATRTYLTALLNRSRGLNEPTSEELARMLTAVSPEDRRKLVNDLVLRRNATDQSLMVNRQLSRNVLGTAAGTGGLAVSGPSGR
jgi:hypothetical protein